MLTMQLFRWGRSHSAPTNPPVKAAIYCLILLLFTALPPAQANKPMMVMANSLEWLTDSSEHIGIYLVTNVDIKKVDGSDNAYISNITAKRFSTLKGNANQQIKFKDMGIGARPNTARQNTEYWPISKGDFYLVFLSNEKNTQTLRYWVNLNRPNGSFDHSTPYSKSFKRLKTKDEILDLVKNRLLIPKAVTTLDEALKIRVAVPLDTEAGIALFRGDRVYMFVPPDDDVKQRLMTQTKTGELIDRARALFRLGAFTDELTQIYIKSFLSDPSTINLGTEEQPQLVYLMQMAAYLTLKETDKSIEKPAALQLDRMADTIFWRMELF